MFNIKKTSSDNPQNVSYKAKGESIVEVVVAIVLLSSVMVAAFSILNRAIKTNVNVKNRIIALNIAREGIEAVRNIRDTNWLKYSGDRRGKWLCLDSIGADTCWNTSLGETIDSGGDGTYYLVDFSDTNNRYYLSTKNENGASIPQSEMDISTRPENDYRLFIDPSNGRLTHTDSGNTPTIFYRQIYIKKINPYGEEASKQPSFCNSGQCDEARIKVVSKVQWKEDGRMLSSVLETNLFDFFERDSY